MFLYIVAALTLGLLPGFAWLIFYLSEDPHPEPKRLIALTFLVGIAFAFFTVALEQWWNRGITFTGISEFSVVSLLGLGFIEETMKFAAAYFSVGRSPELDEPIDRMIYMVVAALGFATLENIGALANLATQPGFVDAALQTGSLRFVGATLLHTLASALIGYRWALAATDGHTVRHLASGILLAGFLHAFFNYLILNYGNIAYTVIFLLVIGFFVLNDFEKLKAKPA